MGSPASQPHTLPLPDPGFPQAKRAAPQARRRQRSAPGWVETHSGSMRSTRARSGLAGDARNRKTSKPLPPQPDEEQNLLYFSTTIRKARSNRIGFTTNARSPAEAHGAAPGPTAPSRPQGGRCRTRQSAPPKRGAGATVSRPCCATRSGCAHRPRLRPGGHRWSPGTTDRPASPRGTDARRG